MKNCAYLRCIANSMSAIWLDMFRIRCSQNDSCQQKNRTDDPHWANKTSLTMHVLHIFNHNCTLFPYQHHFLLYNFFYDVYTFYVYIVFFVYWFYLFSKFFFLSASLQFYLFSMKFNPEIKENSRRKMGYRNSFTFINKMTLNAVVECNFCFFVIVISLY